MIGFLTHLGHFITLHELAFSVCSGFAILLILAEVAWVRKKSPRDTTGNGITIGPAKAFDNRSLALRIERLNAGLETFKVVNQSAMENVGSFQEQRATESSRSLTLSAKVKPEGSAAKDEAKKGHDNAETTPRADLSAEFKQPNVGLGASDILSNQLNLASQIFNLQTLYERSLSDRMMGEGSRLQTVLGFQVSITPPNGYEDCVAVAEIGVRMRAGAEVAAELAAPAGGAAPQPAAAVPGAAPAGAAAAGAAAAPAAAPAVAVAAAPALAAAIPAPAAAPVPAAAPAPAPAAAPAPLPVKVSLIALMPQEKTYNTESISSSERSIEGSAVAKVLTLGLSGKRGARQLFVHRDSDTVAFERDPRVATYLMENATVFGWEVRPVLGRRTVSPGTRQMLAVVAVPLADEDQPGEAVLEIKTCSYWRRYDRNRQTSAPKRSWVPWRVDLSGRVESDIQTLAIPNTAKVQETLAPKVTNIKWVNSGPEKATVIVKGSNLFSGTKVVMGGTVHSDILHPGLNTERATLILKSDQALEFETTLDALTTGDAVLSGRFGPSIQLIVPDAKRPFAALNISSATIRPLRKSKAFRISVNVIGQDVNAQPQTFTVADLQKLPEPILFVGNEPVPMPYDYSDQGPDSNTSLLAKYVRVGPWISAKALAKSSSLSFRLPFCGFDYQSSQPLSFSEPAVVRMGGDGQNIVFRIFYPQGFGATQSSTPTSLSVDLDRTYYENMAPPADPKAPQASLARMSDTEYRFTVPDATVARYQNMVLRIGSAEPYLVPIPPEDNPVPKTGIDYGVKPVQVKRGNRGPVEWGGWALEAITDVSLVQPTTSSDSPAATHIPQEFTTYADGTRLVVYLSAGATDNEGKLTLECTTSTADKLVLSLFVTSS